MVPDYGFETLTVWMCCPVLAQTSRWANSSSGDMMLIGINHEYDKKSKYAN